MSCPASKSTLRTAPHMCNTRLADDRCGPTGYQLKLPPKKHPPGAAHMCRFAHSRLMAAQATAGLPVCILIPLATLQDMPMPAPPPIPAQP